MIKKNRLRIAFITLCLCINSSVFAEKNIQTGSLEAIKFVGILSQGSLVNGKVEPGVDVFLNSKPVQVTPTGDFVLGFGRDADLKQIVTLERLGKKIAEQTLSLTKRNYHIQRINGVPQKMVTPNPTKLARIKAETLMVKTARKENLKYDYFLAPFIAPSDGPITGVYGSQRFFNGTPKRPHFGVDYAGPVGKVVFAPASGVVTMTHDNMYYSGGTLIIDHGYGVSSSFLHLSELLVNKGDHVKQGDPIAKIGSGGRSTGPHLDWRINWFDVRIDPELVLERYK